MTSSSSLTYVYMIDRLMSKVRDMEFSIIPSALPPFWLDEVAETIQLEMSLPGIFSARLWVTSITPLHKGSHASWLRIPRIRNSTRCRQNRSQSVAKLASRFRRAQEFFPQTGKGFLPLETIWQISFITVILIYPTDVIVFQNVSG